MFLDRRDELRALENREKKGNAEFVVLYGRRRVGKTSLLLEFIERYGGVYLLARETSNFENLKRFSDRLARYFSDDFLLRNPFQNWDAFFEYLNQKASERLIVAIDEFPYLIKDDPSLPSVLQEYWDLKFSESKLFLIICGSSIGMMEKLLGYRSPIYGRRTAQMKLKPIDFFNSRLFLPKYNIRDFMVAYGILGGSPAHLLEFDDNISVYENLLNYLENDSFLYQDAFFIFREELDEPRNYFAIMEALAAGKTTLGEIMNETGLSRATVAKYLSVLIDLDFVRREVPVTASWKSRRGRYYIKDNYFAFWFRYVHPNMDLVETRRKNELAELIMNDINSYMGSVFENVAFEVLLHMSGVLPFRIQKTGRWWHRGEEIDLVAINEKEKKALFGEVKWKSLSRADVREILRELKRKSMETGLKGWEHHYCIMAKEVKDDVDADAIIMDLGDIDGLSGI